MKNKVSYVELLKEAISEAATAGYDDTNAFTYKGPLSDPIISYDGGGELQTHKDASSILERYYFKEKESEGRVFVGEDVQEEKPEENEIESGEEADSIEKTMDDLEDELTEDFMLEDDAEGGDAKDAADVPKEFKKDDGGEPEGVAKDVTESMEQSVIEKLISEMEEAGPDKEIEPEKDEETEQAGTDKAGEKEVDKVLEDLELEIAMMEEEEVDEKDKEKDEEGEEDKDLDVDKEVAKESYGLGPIVQSSNKDRVEEAFRLFKEQIEDEEKGEKEEKEGEKEEKEGEEEEKEGKKLEEDFMLEDDDTDKEDEGND